MLNSQGKVQLCDMTPSSHAMLTARARVQVFTFGCGRHGRLGHGDELCEFLPRKLSLPVLDCVNVVDVVAGGKQTFLISEQGQVYSFGYARPDVCTCVCVYTSGTLLLPLAQIVQVICVWCVVCVCPQRCPPY